LSICPRPGSESSAPLASWRVRRCGDDDEFFSKCRRAVVRAAKPRDRSVRSQPAASCPQPECRSALESSSLAATRCARRICREWRQRCSPIRRGGPRQRAAAMPNRRKDVEASFAAHAPPGGKRAIQPCPRVDRQRAPRSTRGSICRSTKAFTDLVKNTYRVLLTRGMKGCYVYFMDEATEHYCRSKIERPPARGGDGDEPA
jgi:Uncharacterized conserved protein (DUF2075)